MKTRLQTEAQSTRPRKWPIGAAEVPLIIKRTSVTGSLRMSDCKNTCLAWQSHSWILFLPGGLVGVVIGFGVVVGVGVVVCTLKENKLYVRLINY